MAKKPNAGSDKLLFNRLKQFDEPGLFHDNYQTPDYVQANLKDALRPYQHGALRYLHYTQRRQEDALLHYRHLLFHMATGAGKTMVMAGTILYLFKEYGYQNFIFFVHTDAIIQKTRENLLNPQSPKYLFSQELEIDGEKITIAPVETFPSVPERNTIYLKLSTIHKMHDELNSYRENSVTYEDLKEIPLVLLGDEAHHFNAGTKAKGKSKTSPENEEQNWERTIENVLALRPDNRLFEFTATIDLANKDIGQKYRDKVVYQYDLKQFMSDGYSKKVMLLEANQNDGDKMLDAVLLSQYRKLTAADNGIASFKPVILFKSGINGHQRGDNLHAIVPGTATGVNLPGNLIEVVTHAGKLTKQRRRDRRKFAGTSRLLVQARLPHPGRELFTVAALQQTPVLIFRYPHGEHFAAFVCQSGLLITPGRAGNAFPGGAALDKPQARQWF